MEDIDIGVQAQLNFMFAERLERVFEVNLFLVERDVELRL